jgi:dTMP kinase
MNTAKNMKPRLITLEGGEACGKSTQIERLRLRLEKTGVPVVALREPGGTLLGEAIRHLLKHAPEGEGMIPEAELLLFAASRAQLVRTVIQPALAEGKWVLCDRYGDSTTVYQGLARRIAAEAVAAVNGFAMGEVRPGLTVVLDVEPQEAARRLQGRSGVLPDRMEREPEDFYRRVREGYRTLAEKDPERIKILPASGTLDEVEAGLWNLVQHAFSL